MSSTPIGLALETSGNEGSVALDDVDPARTFRFTEGMAHGKMLLPSAERLMADAGIKRPDYVAIGIGPGSYTGLRIGVTVARTLAWTWDCPLLGIPSLTALASQVGLTRKTVVTAVDAGQGEIYAASFSWQDGVPRAITEPTMGPPEEMRAEFPTDAFYVGDGCAKMGVAPAIDGLAPDATGVLRLARQRFLAGEKDRIQTVLPLYLRASEAERRFEART